MLNSGTMERRTWWTDLAKDASFQDWAAAADPRLFNGTARLETKNTTYLFRNGSCFAVSYRDPERQPSPEMVGMRLSGWVLTAGNVRRLTRVWQQGACAVLWGTKDAGALPAALTSPSVRFTQYIGGQVMEGRPMLERASGVTLTRFNLAGLLPTPSGVRMTAAAV